MRILTMILTLLVLLLFVAVPAAAQGPPAGVGYFVGLGKSTVSVTYSIPLTKPPSFALYAEGIWAGGKGGAGLATSADTIAVPVAGWLRLTLDDNLVALLSRVRGGGAVLTSDFKHFNCGLYGRLDLASWDF